MDAEELKLRTKQFAIDVARLTQVLPVNRINNAYCNQIVQSASSTGANYRAARRAKSKAYHINKLKIVEEELDESLFFSSYFWCSILFLKTKKITFTKRVKLY